MTETRVTEGGTSADLDMDCLETPIQGIVAKQGPPDAEHLHSDLVYVKTVKHKGRGVFARRAIPEGAVIEHVPVLFYPANLVDGGIHSPIMDCYFFIRDDDTFQVPMGFGCLYNHSFDPNAIYDDGPGATMLFIARRDIAAGEEICINYNGDPECQTPPTGFIAR